MGRKQRVDRSPEEKWQIVPEGIKSGNVSETCRRHGIAPNPFNRWKEEAKQGAKATAEIQFGFRRANKAARYPTWFSHFRPEISPRRPSARDHHCRTGLTNAQIIRIQGHLIPGDRQDDVQAAKNTCDPLP
jgi:transposase-like protein